MRIGKELKKLVLLAIVGGIPVGVSLILPYGTFADLDAIPAHPLIVHGVVVAIPVVSLWMLLGLWKPKVLDASFVPLYALSIFATLGAVAAKSSGQSLSAAVGLPESHAQWGQALIPVTAALAGTLLAIYFFRHVFTVAILQRLVTIVGVIVALALLPLTYLAGHSGARAAWEKDYAKAQEPISRENLVLSMQEVAKRKTIDACWTVIDGVVYDMTTFIARHPAGSYPIRKLCGKDGTEDFAEEHNGQGEPEKWLETLRIGVIGS